MHTIRNLSDDLLLSETSRVVGEERKIGLLVLQHLREVDRRRLYARDYSSLWDYCTRGLLYSEPAAQRRIDAMRLLTDLPELETKIESGALSVTTAARMQSFFKKAIATQEKTFSLEEKSQLLNQVEGKSSNEREQLLAPIAVRVDKTRWIDSEHSEIRFTVDRELLQALERVKEVCAHRLNGKTDYASLLKLMAEVTLETVDPDKKIERAEKRKKSTNVVAYSAEVKPTQTSRYIPAQLKREVWKRDGGQCSHINYTTGELCASRFALECDHILAVALGGETTLKNSRLLCKTHNTAAAVRSFGLPKMAPYLGRTTGSGHSELKYSG